MLPTVIEETEDFYPKESFTISFHCIQSRPKFPLALSTYLKYYRKSTSTSLFHLPRKLLSQAMTSVENIPAEVAEIKAEVKVPEIILSPPSTSGETDKLLKEKQRKDENGYDSDVKRNGHRKPSGGRNGKPMPRRNLRTDKRRYQSYRTWEKSHEDGMVVTYVLSPTQVYMQTHRQQIDYKNVQDCMAKSYGASSYKPSVVASNMLLGVKIDEVFERVRTEEINEEDGAEKQWKVQLIDRGNSTWVSEESLNYLLAGLNDLKPLAIKYTLNELRVSADATDAQINETKQLLVDRTTDVKVDCEIFKPNRDNSVYYVDIFIGEKLLNSELTSLNAVEPKNNYRWKNQRTSTSSVEDAPQSPTSVEGSTQHTGINGNKQMDVRKDSEDSHKDSSPRNEDDRDRRSKRGSSRRWFGGNNSRSRRSTLNNAALKDWAVACYDPNTSVASIRNITDMMSQSDNNVYRPEDVYLEPHISTVRDMVYHIRSVAHNKTNLVLILCIPPDNLQDYSEIEMTGQSLGVSVVFARGTTLVNPQQEVAEKLLNELQEKYQQSPAFLPSMNNNQSYGNNMNGRRRDNRFRRQQNRQRMNNNNGTLSNWEMRNGTDFILTSLKDLSVTVNSMLMTSCGGNLDAPNPSLLTVQLTKAVQNLEDVQTNYKQTRTHCMGVMSAVVALTTNFSAICSPGVISSAEHRI